MKLAAKLVLATLFLGWFGHLAYMRTAADLPDSRALFSELAKRLRPAIPDDASEAITDAMSGLPANPVFNEPPPAGTRWVFRSGSTPSLDVSLTNLGDWEPAARPYLRAVVAYLNDAATSAALAQVRSLRDRRWHFAWQYHTGVLGAVGADGVSYGGFRTLAKVLAARSRLRQAEFGDLEGSWDDLKTVLLLCDGASAGLWMDGLSLVAGEALALTELHRLVLEADLSESAARDIEVTLSRLRDCVDAWVGIGANEAEVTRCLIQSAFTDDGQGGGWLMISHCDQALQAIWPPGTVQPGGHRSRLWNVASFLFNDRRTVEAKWNEYCTAVERAARLPYASATLVFKNLPPRGHVFNIVDGPHAAHLNQGGFTGDYRIYQLYLRTLAARRAARIGVALNRYKVVHGRYPRALRELAPDFISELPLDPFCGASYHYRSESNENFTLYSCGEDGTDNEGKAQERDWSAAAGLDEVYSAGRPDPAAEPALEPAPDAVSTTNADAGGGM